MSSRGVKIQTWWISLWEGEVWTQICWERSKAGGEGHTTGRDGCMASLTQGHEFEQTPGDGEGQGSLECCSPWERKELDVSELLNRKQNQKYRKTAMWGHRKETAIYRPRREVPEETTLLTPWSQTSSLQNCEKMGEKKKKLSHAACSTLLRQPLVNEFRNGAEVL